MKILAWSEIDDILVGATVATAAEAVGSLRRAASSCGAFTTRDAP